MTARRAIAALSICALALLTHVDRCLANNASDFLLAGLVCPPIGIVHGIGVWLGAWP